MQNNPLLFESLFKRSFTSPGNKAFLQEVTAEHPYFSVAQFYLLQKTDKQEIDYNKQAAKTIIHFNNPHWLNFQLKRTQEFIHDCQNISEVEEKRLDSVKPSPKQTVDATSTNEMLLFEPMHLVDYFASQGIKLSDAAEPSDKLGKQLRSFTEWLKTMKKIHPTDSDSPDLKVNAQDEADVHTLAEKSNNENEVVTESMADVFARQGKKDKAIEVYQKLSLLNPAKSAYFAARIEQLKG